MLMLWKKVNWKVYNVSIASKFSTFVRNKDNTLYSKEMRMHEFCTKPYKVQCIRTNQGLGFDKYCCQMVIFGMYFKTGTHLDPLVRLHNAVVV